MTCPSNMTWPGLATSSFLQQFKDVFDGDPRSNGVAGQIYCAAFAGFTSLCPGICANPDIGGPGVRHAFYINAATGAILVFSSPKDSPMAIWSSALLTIAMIVPAILLKQQGALTLSDAQLVMNFATSSAISNLSSATFCKYWRDPHFNSTSTLPKAARVELRTIKGSQRPNGVHSTHSTPYHHVLHDNQHSEPTLRPYSPPLPKMHKWPRSILLLVIMSQVGLQWAWIIYMWISPIYFQSVCNGETTLILFGMRIKEINFNNQTDLNYRLWEGWAGASIALSFLFTVALVASTSPNLALVKTKRKSSRMQSLLQKYDDDGDFRRVLLMGSAAILCTCVFLSNELQIKSNCLLTNGTGWDTWSFGQLAAFLFVLSPLWSIFQAKRIRVLMNDFKLWLHYKDWCRCFRSRKRTVSISTPETEPQQEELEVLERMKYTFTPLQATFSPWRMSFENLPNQIRRQSPGPQSPRSPLSRVSFLSTSASEYSADSMLSDIRRVHFEYADPGITLSSHARYPQY